MGSGADSLTIQHLRGHPVGVSHYSVALPSVRLAELRQFYRLVDGGRSAATPLLRDQSRQAKICHDHRLVLVGKKKGNFFDDQSEESKFCSSLVLRH